jgi:hypothetical protein
MLKVFGIAAETPAGAESSLHVWLRCVRIHLKGPRANSRIILAVNPSGPEISANRLIQNAKFSAATLQVISPAWRIIAP